MREQAKSLNNDTHSLEVSIVVLKNIFCLIVLVIIQLALGVESLEGLYDPILTTPLRLVIVDRLFTQYLS